MKMKKLVIMKLNFESKSGTDPLTVAITSKSHEIVVAPTNLGANLYTKNQDLYLCRNVNFWKLIP